MANYIEEGKEQQSLRRSIPADDSSDRIEALWRQVMLYKTFSESTLADAKARRSQAEAAREKAEQEAAEATRRLCEGLKHEADDKLAEAEHLKSEAASILQQAEAEHRRARDATKEAEEARQRIVSEAKQKAQDIMDQARMAAQQECTELRRQALEEIKMILARVETIRAATDEELETQRIFSNITKLKATSLSPLGQSIHDVADSAVSAEGEPINETNAEDTEPIGHADSSREATPTSGEVPTNGDVASATPVSTGGSAQRRTSARGKKANQPR